MDIQCNGNQNCSIPYNTSVVLSWTSQNADTCTAFGDWSGSKPLSGSETVGPLTSDKTYGIGCVEPDEYPNDDWNTVEAVVDQTTVTVGSPPSGPQLNYRCSGAGTCIFVTDGSGTHSESTCNNSCSAPVETCDDPNADNYGGSLPCTYPSSNAVLGVNSSGAGGVPITQVQGPSNIGGTTNYSRSYTSNISARLRAPSTASGHTFLNWSGCDSTQNPSDCNVAVNTGQSKTVTANYSAPPGQTCEDPNANNFGGPLPCTYEPGTGSCPAGTGNPVTADFFTSWGLSGFIAGNGTSLGYQRVEGNVDGNTRGFVSFSTATIPDNAVIADAKIRARKWTGNGEFYKVNSNFNVPLGLDAYNKPVTNIGGTPGGAGELVEWSVPVNSVYTNQSSQYSVRGSFVRYYNEDPVHGSNTTPWRLRAVYCTPLPTRTLTASINSGQGTITGPGISCPGDCTETYSGDTWVTLIATPAENYSFNNWLPGGGTVCGGQGATCSAFIDGDKAAQVNFSLVPPPFDYSLSNSGDSNVTKTSGNAYTQNTITKTIVSGGGQSVTLSLSGVPAGTSYSISNGTCSPSCVSTITFTVTPSTPTGTFPITVTGSPLNRQTSFNLIVAGSPITVSCSASPGTALLGQTVTWTAAVSGGTPPLTYAWSGTNVPTNPAPDSNPFNIIYSTIGLKTATVAVTDADSVQSTCPPATVQIYFDPNFEEF